MLFVVLMILALLAGCQRAPESDAQPNGAVDGGFIVLSAEQRRTAGIQVDSPRMGTLARRITLRGTIELPPQNRITVTFPLGGIVRSIAVLPGAFVRRGQIIATVEGTQLIELQEQYLTARVLAEQAEREYQRQRDLAQQEATSERMLREAEATMRQRRIAVRALAERLRLVGIEPLQLHDTAISRAIPVRSPCDGYVATIAVQTGQVIHPEQALVELVDVSDVHLVLRAFERDVTALQPGQRLIATVGDDPRNRFSAQIVTIGHVLDSTRSVELHCHFDRYDHQRIRPGMYARADVDIEQPLGYVLPAEAVVAWDNADYVFAPQSNGFRMLPVEVLARRSDSVLVRAAQSHSLPARVVMRGAYWLLMQLKNSSQE
ncbi:MAG: efflux RND transporter periplasmic adaptor subunit [Bacteroidota bacterium]|nr:efflux RND transporter periplasmic adaptor subunit [Bacteroidota bacterium]